MATNSTIPPELLDQLLANYESPDPGGIKVSDAEIETVNLTRHEFHGEWN